jgi:uncharacterized protein (TIGR00251 family)
MQEPPYYEKGKDGVYLRVKVTPKSSKSEVVGVVGDRIKVTVRAVPENGQANDALEQTIANFFNVKKNCCAVTAGFKSSAKTVFVKIAEEEKIKEKLKSWNF